MAFTLLFPFLCELSPSYWSSLDTPGPLGEDVGGTEGRGSGKWGATQSVQYSSPLPFWGDEQQAEGTSPYEWLLRKTRAWLLSLVTQGTLQNTALSERSQSQKVISVPSHGHSGKGKRDSGWDGGLQRAQGNFEGDGNNPHLD